VLLIGYFIEKTFQLETILTNGMQLD